MVRSVSVALQQYFSIQELYLVPVVLAIAYGITRIIKACEQSVYFLIFFALGTILLGPATIATFNWISPLPHPLLLAFFTSLFFLLVAAIAQALIYRKQLFKITLEQDQIQQLTKEAELGILRHQLQPHFLFNTFNSLNALIDINALEAKAMVQLLSNYFRSTIHQAHGQMVSLADELNNLQNYLSIEKIRFGNRLIVQQKTETSHGLIPIPSLLLQPLVENAIKFGLYDTIGEVTIQLRTKVEKANLLITIENPFDIQTAAAHQGTGFGLTAVRKRLELLYNRTDLLQTQVIHKNFIVNVTIPIIQQ